MGKVEDFEVGDVVEVVPFKGHDEGAFTGKVVEVKTTGRYRIGVKHHLGTDYYGAPAVTVIRKANEILDLECPLCGQCRCKENTVAGTYTCEACGAVFGSCNLGNSYLLVSPHMTTEANPPHAAWRYYDLTCLGSEGITRRHGWYDVRTRYIIQVG